MKKEINIKNWIRRILLFPFYPFFPVGFFVIFLWVWLLSNDVKFSDFKEYIKEIFNVAWYFDGRKI